MKYIVILVLFFFSTPAKAVLHVGTSLALLGSDNNRPSFNVGYSIIKGDLVLDFTTNLLPTESSFDKRGYRVTSKTTYAALFLGYKAGRSIWSGFAPFVLVDNNIYYRNFNVDNYDNKALAFGGNVSYFVTKRVAVSTFILLPNTNIDLKLSGGVGLNYYF